MTFTDHRAGMQIALRFPPGWDDHELAEHAAGTGLTCLPLSGFYHKAPVRSGLLVGFSTIAPEEALQPLAGLMDILADYNPVRGGQQQLSPS